MAITEGQNKCEYNSETALIEYIKTVPMLAALPLRRFQDLQAKEQQQIGVKAVSLGEWIRRTGIQKMQFTIRWEAIAATADAKEPTDFETVWALITGLVYSTQIEAKLTNPQAGCRCYNKSVKRNSPNKKNIGNKFVREIIFEAAMIEI